MTPVEQLRRLGFVVQGVQEDGGNWWRTYRLRVPAGYLEVEFLIHEGVWSAHMQIVEAHQGVRVSQGYGESRHVEMGEFNKALVEMLIAFDYFQETGKTHFGYVDSDGGGGRSPELQQYLETALWSSQGDDGEPLDRNYGPDDFTFGSEMRAKVELASFLSQIDPIIQVLHNQFESRGEEDEARNFDDTDVAHDFWLTRNGHGAGFWDKPKKYGEELAKKLTTLSKRFGEVNVMETGDGRVEFA